MHSPKPGSDDWLQQVVEPIIDPNREIIDPHHHFWHHERYPYLLENLWADTQSGHWVSQTVFVECGSNYRTTGPDFLRPVGETEFVAELAARSATDGGGNARVAGIVAHADLRLGDQLEELLSAHEQAANGLFRGVRHEGAISPLPETYGLFGGASPGLYSDPSFRRGLKLLGRRGYVFDAWHYDYQNADFLELARAVPETTLVLNHFGTPVGIGPLAGNLAQSLSQIKADLQPIAECPNVIAKLGGLAMTCSGFGWDKRSTPATSDELVAAQRDIYLHAIDCFGPERCMFESNYPMDRRSLSYHVLWNGFKKMVMNFSDDEQSQLFSETARRVYRL